MSSEGDRDDTSYVQGLLDQGEPVPPGEWWCPGGVTLRPGYSRRVAEAAGREPALTSGPGFLRVDDAVIRWDAHAPGVTGPISGAGPADDPYVEGWTACAGAVADLCEILARSLDSQGGLLARLANRERAKTCREVAETARAMTVVGRDATARLG